MRGLKTAIVVMGVLIVACLGVLVTTIVRRSMAPTMASSGMIAIPPGAVVEGESLDGVRILLRIRLADGRQRLQIADVASGRTLGQFDLVPETPAGR